jgi:uncharacterized membrane protein (Fun14 family)
LGLKCDAMENRLDIGATLSESFALYREHAGVLMPLAFWLFLVVAIVDGLTEGDLSLFWIGELLSTVVGALYEGFAVSLVRDLRAGRREFSVPDLVRSVLPVLGPLIGAAIIYGLGVIFGTLLLVVPGLYLATIWAVAAPVIVIERRQVFDAFGRSRQLVSSNGWRTLGLLLATGVLILAVYLGFRALAIQLADGPIFLTVFNALASTVIAPFGGLMAAVLYFRLLAIKGQPAPVEPPSVPQEPGDGLG